MPELPTWLKQPRFWIIAGVILALVAAGAYFGLARATAVPDQPIPYDHSAHIKNGVACLYCHAGAIQGQSAGLPTLAKCRGCHQQMQAKTAALKTVADYLNKNTTVAWVPVAIQPDFVYFSHRPHLAAGLNCETCHGNVGAMKYAQPQRNMNMGWCLDCHNKQSPDKIVKLTDCATCHK